MVIGEDRLEQEISSSQQVHQKSTADPETLFIMESIIQRLKPRDSHHVRDMITQRGWISGALFMTSVLFWWIAVENSQRGIQDSEIPNSLIGSVDFQQLSIIVPTLIFLATLVMVIGREKGQAYLSQAGGLLVVLALFYIFEPLILHLSEIGAESSILATGRLLSLAIMIHFASRFMFDAMLLQWVRASMLSMEIDVFPNSEYNTEHFPNQIDEEIPLM